MIPYGVKQNKPHKVFKYSFFYIIKFRNFLLNFIIILIISFSFSCASLDTPENTVKTTKETKTTSTKAKPEKKIQPKKTTPDIYKQLDENIVFLLKKINTAITTHDWDLFISCTEKGEIENLLRGQGISKEEYVRYMLNIPPLNAYGEFERENTTSPFYLKDIESLNYTKWEKGDFILTVFGNVSNKKQMRNIKLYILDFLNPPRITGSQ